MQPVSIDANNNMVNNLTAKDLLKLHILWQPFAPKPLVNSVEKGEMSMLCINIENCTAFAIYVGVIPHDVGYSWGEPFASHKVLQPFASHAVLHLQHRNKRYLDYSSVPAKHVSLARNTCTQVNAYLALDLALWSSLRLFIFKQ